MAALVSHAMRRYPLSPPDGVYSYNLRGENSSWSQTTEESESALSRSMRYADPWLYGSVRGTPPGALVLTPAFVLCSCPDYINGTKKSGQKKGPTVCKKCKGTRVSLPSGNGDTKYGTVRCYTTSSGSTLHSASTTTQVRAGTVRVTSSSRPSILPSVTDPYDIMRRSRLNGNSDQTSPFRGRSVSPMKRSNGTSKASGRRSILECDINPYELMSTESGQPAKDSSITFVNGQRIRVRPQAPDPDYEDVDEAPTEKSSPKNSQKENSSDNAFKISRAKPNRAAPEPPPASPSINDSDRINSFKSILKKSRNSSEMFPLSPSRPKSGSHFYLPLPNTPRKKVKFLVEYGDNNKESGRDSVVDSSSEYEDMESHESTDYSDVFEEEDSKFEDERDNKVCTLRRSTSERFKIEPQKVVFLDTMALRSKTPRGDSRETFNACDLEKLDGLVPKRKISPRPKEPPPLPPPQDQFEQEEEDSRKDKEHLVGEMSETSKKVESSRERTEPKHDGTQEERQKDEMKSPPIAREKATHLRSKEETTNKFKSLKDGVKEANISEIRSEERKAFLEMNGVVKQEFTSGEILRKERRVSPKSMPQAPPRKRSINKNMVSVNSLTIDNKILDTFETLGEDDVFNPEVPKDNSSSSKSCTIEPISNSPLTVRLTSDDALKPTDKLSLHISDTVSDHWNNPSSEKGRKFTEDFPNKTIVQITPTSPIHKIQIRNEFPEVNNIQTISIVDNSQRKTSILINGDDCYSTVNVSDDIPLYQSSVVVRDHGITDFIPKFTRRSSSVYITGSFNEENSENSTTQKEGFGDQGDICHCKNTQKIEDEVTKENKVDKEVSTESTERIQSMPKISSNRPSTPDMLREILRDPVEAVKRNLVPHICGKSEVSRRPRNLKLKSHYPSFSFKDLTGSQESKENYRDSDPSSPLRMCSIESLLEDDKDAGSEHSSSTQYEFVDPGSDCYTDHSNRSSVTEEELANRTKFYELLADSALLEVSENEDHHYECINKNDPDPIYEEIEIPPPLPSNPPPISLLDDLKLDKEFTTRSIFEGASKYDILSYLVDAKERGIVPEDSYTFSSISTEDTKERSPKICHMSSVSDSSEDNSLVISGALIDDKTTFPKSSEVERNDSGVGSETSKSSLSKYRSKPVTSALCEDCEVPLEAMGEDEPLLCRKCLKKRSERKEIIMEIVETEEKYSKDLQIVLEEFYQPMLVAGLLTPEQLSTIFLNVEELLENSQSLAERLRDAVEIATEQGDEDLLTVNIGKLFLEAAPMLHAFETYCVRQGPASLLLASLEKEKELLRIFLRVSQMENTLLRRMNLNSFLMVPVQRVTKYPLLLARLYKVSPNHNEAREQLKEAQHKIELHLNHMNSQTKDVPSKLWRRIGSSSGRRPSTEMDLVNIKLRKIAVDVLEWNHEEAKFALEGKLWFTQPTDNNWRKGRTIKLSPVNALLVINGKLTNASKMEREDNALIFPKHSPTREAALLLVRDKNGRYSLLRDPLYLDRCVIASDPAWQSYFEVQELLGKDTFIFKAEDEEQTRMWYQQLQFHAQGMGAWRKRRNALANIMMNGMGLRL